MGWTEYSATHFHKSGAIDRKAECDAYFLESLNRGHYKVIKSTMKGSVYYAAITALKRPIKDSVGNYVTDSHGWYVYEDIPENEHETFGVVMLTYIRNKDQFGYKLISETSGPSYYECPSTILKLLTPTTSSWANEWRNKCLVNAALPKTGNLPIGTIIEFECNGVMTQFRKSKPMYQFKTPFWINDADHTYFSKKRIPKNFKIVSMPKV